MRRCFKEAVLGSSRCAPRARARVTARALRCANAGSGVVLCAGPETQHTTAVDGGAARAWRC